MEQREFIVEAEGAGQRIDRFLSGEDTGLSRSALQALVATIKNSCLPLSRLNAMPWLSTNRSSTTWGMSGRVPTGISTCTAQNLMPWSMPMSTATHSRLKIT